MKKLNTLLLFLFSSIFIFGQFTHLKIPNAETHLVDVEVLSKETYILAEKRSTKLYRTTDAGETWTFNTFPTEFPGSIKGLDFISEKVGFVKTTETINGGFYAGGSEEDHLYRTEDGGENWIKITPGSSDPNTSFDAFMGSFFFFNEKIGICHYKGAMWRTIDGGNNWTNQGPHREHNIVAANEKGIAYFFQARTSHPILDQVVEIYYTNNFGISWQQIDLTDLPIPIGTGKHKMYLVEKTAYISFSNFIYIFKEGILQNSVTLPFTPFLIGGVDELFFIERTATRPHATKIELFKSNDLGQTLESVDILEDSYDLVSSDFKEQTGVLAGTTGNILVFRDKALSIKPTAVSDNIQIAPNPIKKGQSIHINTDILLENKWIIRNSLGQEVLSGILFGREIPTAGIPSSGTYFLELTGDNKRYIQKIVLH